MKYRLFNHHSLIDKNISDVTIYWYVTNHDSINMYSMGEVTMFYVSSLHTYKLHTYNKLHTYI